MTFTTDFKLRKGKPLLSLTVSANIDKPKILIPVGLSGIATYAKCNRQSSNEWIEYYLESFHIPEPFVPEKK